MTPSDEELQRALSEHFRKIGEKGGKKRFAEMTEAEKAKLGRDAAAERWKGHRKKKRGKKQS